jgi:hypothetical protein
MKSTSNKKITPGERGGQDVQKKMMIEAAMLIQSQEYM